MFEKRHHPLLSRKEFVVRQLKHVLWAGGIVGGSLFVGMAGYHWTENMPWIDAFVNASMLLGGMGPVDALHTTGGKLFAGCYALFSGIIFLLGAGVLFAPAFHRFLHRFHLDGEKHSNEDESS